MPRRVRLPTQLGEAFTVAEALEAGLSDGRLRGADLAREFRGARATKAAGLSLAHAYAPLLRPGDRFSHSTAAVLWGCPLDDRRPVHVTAPPGGGSPRGAGVRGHQSRHGTTVMRSNLPVSDPITTFIELAGTLDLARVVRAGDYLVHSPHKRDSRDPRPYVSLDELRRAVATRHDNGIRRAREAAALVRAGAESPTETDLRLLLERHGFRDAVLGFELRDARGRFIGWFDLAWPEYRVIVEYDGDQHRTSTDQYERDIRRFDEASALGWRVIRVRKRGLYTTPKDTVRRVAEAFAAAGLIR